MIDYVVRSYVTNHSRTQRRSPVLAAAKLAWAATMPLAFAHCTGN
jgi:hypothetical protein